MTAEIAVMNKEAIALAADSAVTVGTNLGDKVFTSANKIFALSKYEPVAAMVYGSATLMSVPWEALVKLYRRELKDRQLPTIEEHAKAFLKFLHGHTRLFPEDKCQWFFEMHLSAYFELVRDEMVRDPNATPGVPMNPPNAAKIMSVIGVHLNHWKKTDYLPTAAAKDVRRLRSRYRTLIDKVINDVFKAISLPREAKAALMKIGVWALVKCPEELEWTSTAGLVIAGFGADDFFPVLQSFDVNGIFGGHLNYRPDKMTRINFDNDASLHPFAQADVARTFMEGVDPGYQRSIELSTLRLLREFPAKLIDRCDFLDDAAKKLLKSEFTAAVPVLAKDHFQAMQKRRAGKFWRQIMQLIAVIPKAELATLAESMVTLTTLRRKVEAGVETVAGPVDVALISKGDGFIWVKRKHYFDPKLNHRFFSNYYPHEQVRND